MGRGTFSARAGIGTAVAIARKGNVVSYYWWSQEVLVWEVELYYQLLFRARGQSSGSICDPDPGSLTLLAEVMEWTGGAPPGRLRSADHHRHDFETRPTGNAVPWYEPLEVWYGGPGIRGEARY
jgi:hypothetical protein